MSVIALVQDGKNTVLLAVLSLAIPVNRRACATAELAYYVHR